MTRTGICRSFQVAQLFPELTALENMLIARRLLCRQTSGRVRAAENRRTSLQAARAALEDYGIGEYADPWSPPPPGGA